MPSPTGWSPYRTTPLSSNNTINALLYGTNWASGSLTYSFATHSSYWSTSAVTGYGPSTGAGEPWSPWYEISSSSDKIYAAQILQQWANVANLQFTEVPETNSNVGDIRFAYSYISSHDSAQAWVGGFPGPSAAAGDIWFNALGTSAAKVFKPGTYEGFAVLHELGHALGLKHPFQPSPMVGTVLSDSWDSQSYTVMSYSASTNSLAADASFYPTTPMILDIQAIQYIYGANYNYHAGNDIYTYSDAINYRETIWDGGGVDSINYVGNRNATIDLREGTGSKIGNLIYTYSDTGSIIGTLNNIWIAYGVTIENSIGGNGNDVITGNNANNSLQGGSGNDVIYGGAGDDIFDWGSTNRGGNDIYYGGIGNDVFVLDSVSDQVIEYANEGLDAIWVSFDFSIANLLNVENLLSIGSIGVTLIGNESNNMTVGTIGNDKISGGGGDDLIVGDAGNDSLDGGAGIDKVSFNSNRASHTITKTTTGWSVNSATDGFDTLASIERLYFSDQTLALDINGNAGQSYRLYQAAFNRTPDNGGLKYWIGIMDSGISLQDVSSAFLLSNEFKTLYGANPTNADFVTRLYSNVLHRAPDQGGYNYWVGLLDNHQINARDTLINFSESNENQLALIGVIQDGIPLYP